MTCTPLFARRQRYKLQQHKSERWLRATAEKALLRGSGSKANISAKLFAHDLLGREGNGLESWARRFDLAIGVPATTFARPNVRRTQLPISGVCIRKMKKLRPASTSMLVAEEVDGRLELETSSRESYCTKLHKISKCMQATVWTKSPNTRLTARRQNY